MDSCENYKLTRGMEMEIFEVLSHSRTWDFTATGG